MTLALDERRRGMLGEMGLLGLAAVPAARVGAPAAPAVAIQPATGRQPPAVASAPAPQARVPAMAAATPPDRPIAMLPWDQLAQAVAACQRCRLCEGRHNTVFGMGDTQADWLIVGEAPGEQEDRQGEPFVGPAGKLLDNMLRALGLDRQRNVYIANVLKCRPPANRNPAPEEVAQCEPFLRRQVDLLQPRIILAMGRFAVQSLLGSSEPIGKLRGRPHQYLGVPVIVTYHPAYLLRNLPEKAKAWADLCLAADLMRSQPA